MSPDNRTDSPKKPESFLPSLPTLSESSDPQAKDPLVQVSVMPSCDAARDLMESFGLGEEDCSRMVTDAHLEGVYSLLW